MFGRFFVMSAAVLAATSVYAADLPLRSAPPAPAAPILYTPTPVSSWSGFYIGDQIGVDFFNDSLMARSIAAPVTPLYRASLSGTGFTFSTFAGYNLVMAERFILGVEGSFGSDWMAMRTSTFNAIVPAATPAAGVARVTEWVNAEGSIRLRAGYDIGNNMLIYGTGGAAGASVARKFATLVAPGGVNAFQGWKPGWTLGLGLEYRFASNWFARMEYRYSRYYNISDTAPTSAAFVGDRLSHSLSASTIQVGIGYLFGAHAASPVVAAKY